MNIIMVTHTRVNIAPGTCYGQTDVSVADTFQQEAEKCHVTIYEILSIEEMSKAMGKVNKAVIGVKDIGFSKKMISIINGGEEIG